MGYSSLVMKSFTIATALLALLAIVKAGPITEESIRSSGKHPPIGFEESVLPLRRASVFIDGSTEPSSTLKSDAHLLFLDKVQELSTPDIYIPEVDAAVHENITQKANATEIYVTTIADSEPHNVSAVVYVSLLENVKVKEVTKLETDTSTANLDEVSITTSAPAANMTIIEEPDDIAVPVMLLKPHEPKTPRIVLTLSDLREAEELAEAKVRQEQALELKPNYKLPAILKISDALNESKPRGIVQEIPVPRGIVQGIPVRESIQFEVPSIVNNYFYNVFMSLLGANPYGRLQPVLPILPVGSTRPSRSIPVLLDLKSALASNCTEHMNN